MGGLWSKAEQKAEQGMADIKAQLPVSKALGQQPSPQPAPPVAPAPAPAAAPTPTPAPTTTVGGGTRKKRKRSTKNNKTKGRIDFSKIKWGSFTKIYNNYIKNHPHMKSQIPDLKHFAHYVNKHPAQFNKKTHKKSLFYINIIEK
jgi:hypothetical protein